MQLPLGLCFERRLERTSSRAAPTAGRERRQRNRGSSERTLRWPPAFEWSFRAVPTAGPRVVAKKQNVLCHPDRRGGIAIDSAAASSAAACDLGNDSSPTRCSGRNDNPCLNLNEHRHSDRGGGTVTVCAALMWKRLKFKRGSSTSRCFGRNDNGTGPELRPTAHPRPIPRRGACGSLCHRRLPSSGSAAGRSGRFGGGFLWLEGPREGTHPAASPCRCPP